jgi:outer membrane protein assembly factor BamE (lipoprotein component of BamABCDE complex)
MKSSIALLSLLLLGACSTPLPSIDGFDADLWKNDRNACQGHRKAQKQSLLSQKSKLLALKESQVVKLLGRPDENELYERNQKFYYYYLTASPTCSKPDSVQQRLELRFNAMGLVKEVFIKD